MSLLSHNGINPSVKAPPSSKPNYPPLENTVMLRVRASTYELGAGEWGDTDTNTVRVFPGSSRLQENQNFLTGSPITPISASIFLHLPLHASFLCVFPMRTLVIEFGSLSQDTHLKILKLCLL